MPDGINLKRIFFWLLCCLAAKFTMTGKKYAGKHYNSEKTHARTRPAGAGKKETYAAEVLCGTELGIHARPAGSIIEFTTQEKYDDCDITFRYNGSIVNGKSVMGVISLGLDYLKTARISVSGNGASKECFEGLVAMLKRDLDKHPFKLNNS